MGIGAVRSFLSKHAPDITVLEHASSTATATEAAAVHGVALSQIAKTLSLWVGGEAILLVMAGDAKVDNRLFKDRFLSKPRFLEIEDVARITGHPAGGVCPFGLATPLKVFVDESLQCCDVVVLAAGAPSATLAASPSRLLELTQAQWVRVAQSGRGE